MSKVNPPKPKTLINNPFQDTPMDTIHVGSINIPDDDDVSLLCTPPPNNVISVEHCSDIDLQQLREKTRIIDLNDSTDDDVQFLHSSASFKTCEICTETKPISESFAITGCTHSYCSDCMVKYVCSKLDHNITHVPCPFSGCNEGVLEPDQCRRILPPEVFDRWGIALCESVIPTSEKFYCPFKDCSALMIDDGDGGGGAIVEAECHDCHRLFCARCKVPWHLGIGCSEYQNLSKDERGREDIMLMKLAEEKRWTRCPKCQIYVEKTEGCLFILCRFGFSLRMCLLFSYENNMFG